MLKRILSIVLLSLAFSATAGTSIPKTVLLPQKSAGEITSANTVFLWDFHDVIVKRDLKKTIGTVWNSNHKFKIVRKTNLKLLGKMLGMIVKSKTSSEELIQLAKKNKNPYLQKLIYKAACVQKPIRGTVALIDILAKNGYRHYIGSNIAESIFKQISNPKKYPQFASLFANFNLENPQTVSFNQASPERTLQKPDVRFFSEFLRKNNIDLATTNVIFIDDNIKNVIAAQKAGMIGIQFISPEQLQNDLQWLGIGSLESNSNE